MMPDPTRLTVTSRRVPGVALFLGLALIIALTSAATASDTPQLVTTADVATARKALMPASAAFKSPSLQPYVDALTVPRVAVGSNANPGMDTYNIRAIQFTQKMHRDLPATLLWGYDDGYGASFPGPTIVAHKGRPVRVTWTNALPPPGHHPLPVDRTLMPLDMGATDDRMIVHLHGGQVPSDSDGTPELAYETGVSKTFNYPNNQTARLMWYHDHAWGLTRLNTQIGLAAGYLLTDAFEASLNLPGPIGSQFDVPLIICDKTFRSNGRLYYPSKYSDPDRNAPFPSCVPEFFGDTNLVNGTVWPYLNAQPRKYRFRLLNAASARFYRLSLHVVDGQGRLGQTLPLVQIGNEGGFLTAPVVIDPATGAGGNNGQLLLAPAERADIVVDFSQFAGKTIVLTNDAPAPFPTGDELPDPSAAGTTGQVMQFRISASPANPVNTPDTSVIPAQLATIPDLRNPIRFPIAQSRVLGLWETFDQYGRLIQKLGTMGGQAYEDPTTEFIKLGTIEKWNIVNTTMDMHPIHIHEFNGQLVQRRPFDMRYYLNTGLISYTGPAVAPAPNELQAWKETFQCPPGMVTTFLVDARVGYPGKYVWHCHILEHEEHDMMRPFEVTQ